MKEGGREGGSEGGRVVGKEGGKEEINKHTNKQSQTHTPSLSSITMVVVWLVKLTPLGRASNSTSPMKYSGPSTIMSSWITTRTSPVRELESRATSTGSKGSPVSIM